MATTTPSYIGRYRLLNVVHTGQQSLIWQAFDDGNQRMVGIKTLTKEFRKNKEQLAFLRLEYNIGRKLVHKRIIEFIEFSVDRGVPYLALEWFSAPNMKQRLNDGADKVAYLVPKIVEQAAEGLAYFNAQGWVHRDVKPDNFLVNDEGQVKLIDLALAVRSKGGLGKLLALKSKKVQGTPSYMSPEQIRGQALDIRADVYSFGCTAYHLAAGIPPYTGKNANELLNKHLKASPPSLTALNDNVTPGFAQLVRRALAKDPAERPQSMSDFLTALRMTKVFHRTPLPPEKAAANQQR